MPTTGRDAAAPSSPDIDRESPVSDPGHTPSGLVIPQPRDGFFGYTEEKSHQHVRFISNFHKIDYIPQLISSQIEEKYLAHRRASDAHSDSATSGSFGTSFKLSSIHVPTAPPPGELPTGSTPWVEEEDEKTMKTEVLVPGAYQPLFRASYN